MGMLLQYHRQAAEAPAPKAKRQRRKRGKAQAEATEPSGSYADLTDEQVAEAYAATIPDGEATARDAQVIELRAVAAYAHTFDADPKASTDE